MLCLAERTGGSTCATRRRSNRSTGRSGWWEKGWRSSCTTRR